MIIGAMREYIGYYYLVNRICFSVLFAGVAGVDFQMACFIPVIVSVYTYCTTNPMNEINLFILVLW